MRNVELNSTINRVQCDHCGEVCQKDTKSLGSINFCCIGCETVFNIINDNKLGAYYKYTNNPGISQKKIHSSDYGYLNNHNIVDKLISFKENGIAKVKLDLPQIHCSSCLWLLEHITTLNEGIINSVVNFKHKTATITYRENKTSLKAVVQLLASIGYEPRINYDLLYNNHKSKSNNHQLIHKLGLAGFSFGNIMLLSFPEYLGFEKASYLFYIGYINIILALPVLLYSGIDYLKSAFIGIKLRDFNIDIPIAIGMIALFGRSVYEILSRSGEGYLDSFAGFIFFLLIGRWFQATTYKALDFDRNYRSYFPISATVQVNRKWVTKSINFLVKGDVLRIRNYELIPTDAIVTQGKARIDYSFVTGESNLITKLAGQKVYAGGRHLGETIQIKTIKTVDQSYLTQLWNEDTFKSLKKSKTSKLVSFISKYFTLSIIVLAMATMCYWLFTDVSLAFNAFTSVLIVACPCALALAIPFTYGNILRLLSIKGIYLKHVNTIENIQDIDYIILDKTGTITDNNKIETTYHGKPLSTNEAIYLKSLCSHSAHPLSKAIVNYFNNIETIEVDEYLDKIGYGISSKVNGNHIKVGSTAYIFESDKVSNKSGVFVEINGSYIGWFEFKHAFRKNLKKVIDELSSHYNLAILSGDTNHEIDRFNKLVGSNCKLYFNQSPKDKLIKIRSLQNLGHKVMMIGDGLNDAGALKQANVGIVISDKENNFSPACDGIIEAENFEKLYDLFDDLNKGKYIIYGAFFLAIIYNSIGMYFAISGQLSPVIAAILMPLSSITIIVYGIVTSNILLSKGKMK